ncbi:hypothetical protein GSbR_25740 [Geobacter sp. SVR]|nr:hypothetical protein GSbR_25740 [Geobacter sp. SVR]
MLEYIADFNRVAGLFQGFNLFQTGQASRLGEKDDVRHSGPRLIEVLALLFYTRHVPSKNINDYRTLCDHA